MLRPEQHIYMSLLHLFSFRARSTGGRTQQTTGPWRPARSNSAVPFHSMKPRPVSPTLAH
ncbi:hypothetical protein NITLEN_11061 [Nitrospira lenta]|uniref:Uncharacterized protein n=1 Tax=Nitrospira lenta TaxID=1436998 RepID=A0A330L2J8_9BACT|nr:hypothetical protein NITLEN_11061 [Nitrospira lenta]